MDETGSRVIPPRLREVLVSLDAPDRRAVADLVVLHAEFPAWAVRVPRGGEEWRAVRSASDRVPDAGLPLVWAGAATAEELAGRMRRIDAWFREGR
jgi:hypothetical protein